MKKHIWKKSFSISFVFHFIVVITIGAMVAGFHQEIQRPKEELITVNLADTPEQRAKAQEKSSFNSFSRDIENIFKHNTDNDNQNIKNKNNEVNQNKDIKQINNVENKQIEKDEISAENGILPASNNITNTISEDDTQAISDGIGQEMVRIFLVAKIKTVAVEVVAQQKAWLVAIMKELVAEQMLQKIDIV